MEWPPAPPSQQLQQSAISRRSPRHTTKFQKFNIALFISTACAPPHNLLQPLRHKVSAGTRTAAQARCSSNRQYEVVVHFHGAGLLSHLLQAMSDTDWPHHGPGGYQRASQRGSRCWICGGRSGIGTNHCHYHPTNVRHSMRHIS